MAKPTNNEIVTVKRTSIDRNGRSNLPLKRTLPHSDEDCIQNGNRYFHASWTLSNVYFSKPCFCVFRAGQCLTRFPVFNNWIRCTPQVFQNNECIRNEQATKHGADHGNAEVSHSNHRRAIFVHANKSPLVGRSVFEVNGQVLYDILNGHVWTDGCFPLAARAEQGRNGNNGQHLGRGQM